MMLYFLILAMVLVVLRAVIGPTAPDRVIAFEAVGTLVVFLLCFIAYFYQEWYLIDIALVYTSLTFISVIIIAKYLRGDFVD